MTAENTMRAPMEDRPRNGPPAGFGYLKEGDIAAAAHGHEATGERNPVNGFLRRRNRVWADHLSPIQAHELNSSVVRAEPIARSPWAASRPGNFEIRHGDRADVQTLVGDVGNHQR